MEEKVRNYLINETQEKSEVVREMLTEKVLKYDDIAAEFGRWLETRSYEGGELKVGGYTAAEIYQMAPQLDGIGVYNFLVTLRDNPKLAEEIIRHGFAVM